MAAAASMNGGDKKWKIRYDDEILAISSCNFFFKALLQLSSPVPFQSGREENGFCTFERKGREEAKVLSILLL